MEKQSETRYVLGTREEDGRYPVTVDGSPAGTVHRRHGSWYLTIPGRTNPNRFSDRFAAAEQIEALYDQGIRPTIPAPGTLPTPSTSPAATESYRHLLPDLRLTLANLVRAAEAMARLAQLGWVPLEGYPGADQPWRMECRLCGWKGHRFWSHLRGRNGDRTPRPVTRHPGCIPVKDMPAALITLASERCLTCPCEEYRHPTSTDGAVTAVNVIGTALETGAPGRAVRAARAILEPCPAATSRADLVRWAYDRRVKWMAS
ncbi:hypothetical protein OG285_38530 [Streptomyces sp. NBC_01471]|uniref:hypothetical protein n=1 Tax=Streptomyces sp. NBC_01471 TaxID=2903879 RepID=UPI00324442E2